MAIVTVIRTETERGQKGKRAKPWITIYMNATIMQVVWRNMDAHSFREHMV